MDEAERELELKILHAEFEAYKIADAMHEADKIADPARVMSADELKHFVLPALEASKDQEKRKNDFGKYYRLLLSYMANEDGQLRLSILAPVMAMVGSAHMDGLYQGMRAGYALHKYGKWLDSKEWLKKVMRVMRDFPGITPDRMCRELDRRYKQTVSGTGKHKEEKATPEGWSYLSWIDELLMNRRNVDVLRSKAKKQLDEMIPRVQ